MRFLAACLLVPFLLHCGAGVVWAQSNAVSDVDVTKRDDRTGSKRWSGPGKARIGQDNPWPGSKTIQFGSWHGSYSNLGRKMAPIEEKAGERKEARLKSGMRTFPRLGMSDRHASFNGHKSFFRNFNRVGPAGNYGADERIQGLVTTEVEVSREEFAAGKGAPRLEDINRYVFRKNGAAEEGQVPVAPAAGGTEPEVGKR